MMKRIQYTAGLVFLIGAIFAPVSRAAYSESVRQALRKAVGDARESLEEAALPEGETVSILGVRGDRENYVEGLLKNAVTDADIPYVEGSEDPFWDAVMREVEWDERKEDMLDAATLTQFGKLKSTQLLLYGTVREVTETPQRVYVELELHLSSIETKQHLWGGVFAHRFYLPDTVQGLVDLDEAVRETLKTAVADASATVAASPKLKGVSTVAVVPFAGDIDGYVRQLAVDMLSGTSLTPRDLDFSTLAEARQAMRDTPERADAILVGAVRDLAREKIEELPQKTTYEVRAEVQLSIQDAVSGDVLWSQTLSAKTQDVDETSIEGTAWRLFKDNPMWKDAGTVRVAQEEITDPTANNVLDMAFVEIAPGSFKMGSNDGDGDEKPIHDVRISHRFWMGKYEVTNGQYKVFLQESKYDGSADADSDYLEHFRGNSNMPTASNHPICWVSWKNATAFCNWLTERERRAGRLPDGYVYRLPTEAEWEYAARGGNKSQGYKYSGSNNVGDVAWYDGNSGSKTHEVVRKRANELGLYDMSGNVWEWCYDWYDSDYYGKSPETNPVNTEAASVRVKRGGSWFNSSWLVRSACRFRFGPEGTDGDLGFRVCLAPRIRLGMAFVEIAPGSFKMGSPRNEDNRDGDEQLHDVRISHRFWMGKYEVTNGQYKQFLQESKYDGSADADSDYLEHFRGNSNMPTASNHPICWVSWKNATAFCNWLTERERRAGRLPDGYVYRLPTEAEWEYAARGGNKSQGYKYSGSNNVGDVAWYDGNSGSKTHEVERKRANELGLYDMSGNVWEWCYDWYDSDYYGKSPETNPVNTEAASSRV